MFNLGGYNFVKKGYLFATLLLLINFSTVAQRITVQNISGGSQVFILSGLGVDSLIMKGKLSNAAFMSKLQDSIVSRLTQITQRLTILEQTARTTKTQQNSNTVEIKSQIGELENEIRALADSSIGITAIATKIDSIHCLDSIISNQLLRLPEIVTLSKAIYQIESCNQIALGRIEDKTTETNSYIHKLVDSKPCILCRSLREKDIALMASVYLSSGFSLSKIDIGNIKINSGEVLNAGFSLTGYFNHIRWPNLLFNCGFVYGNFNVITNTSESETVAQRIPRGSPLPPSNSIVITNYYSFKEQFRFGFIETGLGTNIHPIPIKANKKGNQSFICIPVQGLLGINCWGQYINYYLPLTEVNTNKLSRIMGGAGIGIGYLWLNHKRCGMEVTANYKAYLTNYFNERYIDPVTGLKPFENLNSRLNYASIQFKIILN